MTPEHFLGKAHQTQFSTYLNIFLRPKDVLEENPERPLHFLRIFLWSTTVRRYFQRKKGQVVN